MADEPAPKEFDDEERRAEEFIEAGGELVAAMAGGAVGTLGGPLGVVAGAAAGVATQRVVRRVGAELQQRVLGPRQQARAGAALVVASSRSRERDEAGEPRQGETFYEPGPDGRVPAEELLEGVLLRSSEAYEERRVRHLGAFYAAVEHRPNLTPAHANQLLRIADSLSYRQLVIVAFFHAWGGDKELIHLSGRRAETGHQPFPDGLGSEIQALADNPGLLGVQQPGGRVVPAGRTWDGEDIESTDQLGRLRLTDLGELIYELMDLDGIPSDEQRGILEAMQRSIED